MSTTCIDGHHFTWRSQPLAGNVFAGSLIVPAAVFITGNSYGSFVEILGSLSVQSLSTRQRYTIQQQYIVPEVEKAWTRHSEAVLAAAAGEKLIVSGDSRCDSPGQCVSCGTYTMLDITSHLIVAQETVHVTEVANSYWLEPEGLKRFVEKMTAHRATPSVIATDRHPAIQMLREEYSDTDHEYDLWHIVKSIKKKLLKSKIPELLQWINVICNHLWYSVATCTGDALLPKEKWLSILNHITDRHSWVNGVKFTSCSIHLTAQRSGDQGHGWTETQMGLPHFRRL